VTASGGGIAFPFVESSSQEKNPCGKRVKWGIRTWPVSFLKKTNREGRGSTTKGGVKKMLNSKKNYPSAFPGPGTVPVHTKDILKNKILTGRSEFLIGG